MDGRKQTSKQEVWYDDVDRMKTLATPHRRTLENFHQGQQVQVVGACGQQDCSLMSSSQQRICSSIFHNDPTFC